MIYLFLGQQDFSFGTKDGVIKMYPSKSEACNQITTVIVEKKDVDDSKKIFQRRLLEISENCFMIKGPNLQGTSKDSSASNPKIVKDNKTFVNENFQQYTMNRNCIPQGKPNLKRQSKIRD